MGNSSSRILDSLSTGTNFDNDDINKLVRMFLKLDKDSSGAIDKAEFLSIPGIASNPLAKRVVEIFDKDRGGDVDLKEFIEGLSIFSNKADPEDKLLFAFKIYDIDGDNYISNGELFIVLKMMVGEGLTDIQLQQLVDRTILENDEDHDGKLNYEEFRNAIDRTAVANSLTLDDY
ncbi:unnamed protein product [Kuraishia capsulata CBS 1993]|uniref:Calcineurin subunit B n=1 Tax=Kuraishia capsulata CBS 1993 TaxID=1382522 RepID=W6MIM0_9ASCO|nr:uncharacterized protein KUCA_T00000177001 [Kuraishia capsulata CBS 1993]CDK24217.1 unnamed protein product [Kuraishia capsulata CBS 1993]